MEIINEKNWRFFLYVVLNVALVFALNFYYLHIDNILLYAIVILASSFLIFIVKNIVGEFFHARINGKFWISGLIFSAVATLVASSFGIPIPIPVISYNNYERKNTIKGLKKGAVNMHEKWEITFLSSIILLFSALVFISLFNVLKNNAFLLSGVAIAMFVFIDFLPERRFNGANLIYHNTIIYSLTFIFLLIIGTLSIVNYSISFVVFIAFIIFIITTYALKLW